MKIAEADNPGILNRFAVSDDGFRFSITVNQEANQVYISAAAALASIRPKERCKEAAR